MRFYWTLLFPAHVLCALTYDVHFTGLANPDALSAVKDASDLVALQNRPPASINGLRYRADADIPQMLKALRAFAYYDADISFHIESEGDKANVNVFIESGPQYALSSYEVFHGDCKISEAIPPCCPMAPQDLGLSLGQPAVSTSIVNAELTLLTELSKCGYPLAVVDRRRVIVDMAEKKVDAAVCVQEGSPAHFGPITFFGLKDIHPRYLERKIAWSEGELYNSDLIEETQKRLLKSDLFSSVMITHSEQLDEAGELPMKVRFAEAKHRSFSIGAFYATVDGPGAVVAWTNRNFRKRGEQLSWQVDVSQNFIGGYATFRKFDFLRLDQTFSARAEVSREDVFPYHALLYSLSNRIERVYGTQNMVSLGLKGDYYNITHSANNGFFFVLGLPFMAKASIVNSLLDPTRGYTFVFQCTPYQSLTEKHVHYLKQRLTLNFYMPVTANRKVVFALRAQFGSLFGAHRSTVPLPLLFLGGSEDDLRGYRYRSVSPLKHGKPLGGRSAIFGTFETRFRITKSLGFVPFFDVGTVSNTEIPQPDAKWFKSIGFGIRYFTFFGPLRADIGFPLNRRSIDHAFQIYASVGQAF